MRCPDCNKFVSFDADTDPEITDGPEVMDDNLTVRITVRRVLTCAECGAELKAELELDQMLLEIDSAPHTTCVAEHAWEIEDADTSVSATEERKRGHMLYGVEVDGSATCVRCGAHATFHGTDSISGGEMDDLT